MSTVNCCNTPMALAVVDVNPFFSLVPNLSSSPIFSISSSSSSCQWDYNPFRTINLNVFSISHDAASSSSSWSPWSPLSSSQLPTNSTTEFLRFTNQELFILNVCFIISSIFLILSLLVYLIVPELRTVPGRCMMGLIFSELILNWCIMAAIDLLHANQHGTNTCVVVGVAIHYFFLSIICWTNVIAYDLLRKIKCPTRKLHYFIRYVYFAYLAPLVVILVALLLEHGLSDQSPMCALRPHYGQRICGVSTELSSLVFAIIPLVFTVLLIFCTLMYAIYRLRQNLTDIMSIGKYQDSVWVRFVLYGKLFILLGIFSLFGFLGVLLNYCHLVNFVSLIISSLHGAGIFLVFTCKRSILHRLNRRLQTWKIGRTETRTTNGIIKHNHQRAGSGSKNSISVTIHFQSPTQATATPPPPPIRI